VRASSLKQAVEMATHSYDPNTVPHITSWPDKRSVQAFQRPCMDYIRDIQPGDVIVTPSGQPYRYELSTAPRN
jgi:hypothetical protein